MRLLSLFAGLLIFIPTHHASAEPVPEFMKGRAAKTKKKAKKKSKRTRHPVRRSRKPGATRGSGPASCRFKPMKAVKNLRIDPAIERLFQNNMTIDGALYPSRRLGLKSCCPKNNDGDCYSQTEAETKHQCYDNRRPDDFRDIRREMGIKIGSGPYTDARRDDVERFRREGRNIRIIRTSNDLDRVVRAQEYGTVLYIQSWDEEHYQMAPKRLARHIYNLGGRVVQPAYNRANNNELDTYCAGGAMQDRTRLSEAGKTLVKTLFEQYMLVDLSHVGKRSSMDIVEMALQEPPSLQIRQCHRGLRRPLGIPTVQWCKSRNLDDETICAIARTGGVIGYPHPFHVCPKPAGGV